MVIETFKEPAEIYRRFKENGRMLPIGLNYISSWVDKEFKRCFQLMETENVRLFDEWTTNWNDLTDFEVIPVISSADAVEVNQNNN